jgi:UPF0755 protein
VTASPSRPAPKRRKRRRKKGPRASEPEIGLRVPTPGPRSDWARLLRWGRWGAAGASLAALAAASWLFLLYPSEHGPGEGNAVEIIIAGEPGPDELAAKLAAAGVLAHPALFAWWARLSGGTGAVVDGPHILTDDASPRELLARLERRGAAHFVRVTFPEGWTRFDMARRLQEKHVVPLRAFLDATTAPDLLRELAIDGDSAEGFLFPATYDLTLDSDGRDVVRRMKREFDRRWDILARAHASTLTDVMSSASFGVRDVVTLASMVEKEAVADDERPIIASVFLNRLRDPAFHPKRLECDPTASYGCVVAPEKAASCASFAGKATAAIEHDLDNPYSTYTHDGLPPGPIANPGARSIEAAMSPATSRFFYFVAKGEGRHAFSETYGAHAENVTSYTRRNPSP